MASLQPSADEIVYAQMLGVATVAHGFDGKPVVYVRESRADAGEDPVTARTKTEMATRLENKIR